LKKKLKYERFPGRGKFYLQTKFDLFQKHRDELNEFAHDVADTSIRFVYQSYAELWSEWIAEGIFETHVKKLQAQYSIKL
jgi:hypothetical protein